MKSAARCPLGAVTRHDEPARHLACMAHTTASAHRTVEHYPCSDLIAASVHCTRYGGAELVGALSGRREAVSMRVGTLAHSVANTLYKSKATSVLDCFVCRHALIATTFQPVVLSMIRFSPCNRSITRSSRTFAHKAKGRSTIPTPV